MIKKKEKLSNAIGEGKDLKIQKINCLTGEVESLMRSRANAGGITYEQPFCRSVVDESRGRDWIHIACGIISIKNLNLKYNSYENLNIA